MLRARGLLVCSLIAVVLFFSAGYKPNVREMSREEAEAIITQDAIAFSKKYDSLKQDSLDRVEYGLSEKFSDLEPVTWKDCYALGVIYLKDKEYERAQAMFRAAIKQVPDSAVIWNLLATVYDSLGKKEKAIKVREIVKKINKK